MLDEDYGQELILDLHQCDINTFSRKSIGSYFDNLCRLIDMKAEDRYFWDDEGLPPEECQTNPKTCGISAVQFILTEAGDALMTENSRFLITEPVSIISKSMVAENTGDVIRRHRFFLTATDSHISLKFQNEIVDQTLYVESVAVDVQAMQDR